MNNIWRAYPHKVIISYDQERSEFGTVSDSRYAFMEMSAGHPVFQDQEIIDNSIKNKSFFRNRVLLDLINYAREHNSNIHLFGLLSDVGLHSHINHVYALMELFHRNNFTRVYLDAVLDGINTEKVEGIKFLQMFKKKSTELGFGNISSVVGRDWVMSRNPEKIASTLNLIFNQDGNTSDSIETLLNKNYEKNIFDSEIPPTLIKISDSFQTIKEMDVVIFFNYRFDAIKPFVNTFSQYNEKPNNIYFVTFTKYSKSILNPIVFPRASLPDVLPSVLAKYNKTNIRISDRTKESHLVTFFNGGREETFGGEDRIIFDVSKKQNDYIMNAPKITQAALDSIKSKKYDFILIDYPNTDKVAHTGDINLASMTVKYIDKEVEKVTKTAIKYGGAVIITSDHGNIEQVELNKNIRNLRTIHTRNPVPFIFIAKNKKKNLIQGALTAPYSTLSKLIMAKNTMSDFAPTILEIMGLPKPDAMIGHSFYKYLE